MPAPTAPTLSTPGPLDPILLAGSINLLAGSSGAGKTALMAMMAKHLQQKLPLFGVTPTTAPYVAYIGIDKSWTRSSCQWFQREDVRLPHYAMTDDRAFRKSRLRSKTDRVVIFREFLHKVAPDGRAFPLGSLVFFEPLALFLGGNLLDYDASAVACLELREVCQELNDVCVVGAVHAGKFKADKKQGYARLQDHILGTAALWGYTDTQLYLAAPDEVRAKHALLHVNPHHAPPMQLKLRRAKDGRFLSEIEAEAAGIVGPSWIVEVLAAAPDRTLGTADLLKAAIERELSRATLHRLLDEELRYGRVRRVGHGRYQLAAVC